MKLEGIHHITAITADAQQNVDFYAGVLGLRLVKKSINQDDTSVYHLFYADEKGDPGSDLTFFEYPGVPRGRPGAGMIHRIVWRVSSDEALNFWAERLEHRGYESTRLKDSLTFDDPEGLTHELRPVEVPDEPLVAEHPEIPAELALQGFHAVRAYASAPERSAALLEDTLGFSQPVRVGPDDQIISRELRGDRRGGFYLYEPPPLETTAPGSRQRPPRRVGLTPRRPGGLASARPAGRRARHADHRPLLLPVDLLSRAVRGAVRAGHDRARLHRRRAT